MKSLFTCGMCDFATPSPELMSKHIRSHLAIPREKVLTTEDISFHMDSTTDDTGSLESRISIGKINKEKTTIKVETPKTSRNSRKHARKTQGNISNKRNSRLMAAKKRPSTSSVFVPSKLSSEQIASEALIGYLEPRKVKPVSPISNEQVKSIPSAVKSSEKVKPTPTVTSVEMTPRSALSKLKYKHPETVYVSFSTNKHKILATTSDAKTIQPCTDSIEKKQLAPVKLMLKAKMIPKPQANVQRNSTRSIQSVILNGSAPASSVLSSSENRLKSERLVTKKGENSRMGQIRTEEEEENLTYQDVTASTRKISENEVDIPQSEINKLGPNSPSDSQFSHVTSQPVHKKPKKDILLRYQEELSRVEFPQAFIADTDIQYNKISDLKGGSFSTKVTTIITDAIEMTSDKAITIACKKSSDNLSVPCKIVLSHCVPPKAAKLKTLTSLGTQLKSSLQNIWLKRDSLNTTPSVKTKATKSHQSPSSQSIHLQKKRRKIGVTKKHAISVSSAFVGRKTTYEKHKYKCEFCIFSASNKAGLGAHVSQRHAKEEPMYICETCDYLTSRESKLIAHRKSHKAENAKPNSGEEKSMAALPSQKMQRKTLRQSRQDDVKHFENTNLGSKGFDNPSGNLQKIATPQSPSIKDLPPYNCRFCKFSASRWDLYVKHQITSHVSTDNLSCHLCHYKCVDPRVLKTHRLLAHSTKLADKHSPLNLPDSSKGSMAREIQYKQLGALKYHSDLTTKTLIF